MEHFEAIKSTMAALFAMALLTQFISLFSGDPIEKSSITMISGLMAGIYILKMFIRLIGIM